MTFQEVCDILTKIQANPSLAKMVDWVAAIDAVNVELMGIEGGSTAGPMLDSEFSLDEMELAGKVIDDLQANT